MAAALMAFILVLCVPHCASWIYLLFWGWLQMWASNPSCHWIHPKGFPQKTNPATEFMKTKIRPQKLRDTYEEAVFN